METMFVNINWTWCAASKCATRAPQRIHSIHNREAISPSSHKVINLWAGLRAVAGASRRRYTNRVNGIITFTLSSVLPLIAHKPSQKQFINSYFRHFISIIVCASICPSLQQVIHIGRVHLGRRSPADAIRPKRPVKTNRVIEICRANIQYLILMRSLVAYALFILQEPAKRKKKTTRKRSGAFTGCAFRSQLMLLAATCFFFFIRFYQKAIFFYLAELMQSNIKRKA